MSEPEEPTRADLPGNWEEWRQNASQVMGREVSAEDFWNPVFLAELEAAQSAGFVE